MLFNWQTCFLDNVTLVSLLKVRCFWTKEKMRPNISKPKEIGRCKKLVSKVAPSTFPELPVPLRIEKHVYMFSKWKRVSKKLGPMQPITYEKGNNLLTLLLEPGSLFSHQMWRNVGGDAASHQWALQPQVSHAHPSRLGQSLVDLAVQESRMVAGTWKFAYMLDLH